ncbi:MAG TPA: hypothetical protein VID28_00185 [Methylomirabilota bacterium]|jgi:hypothetical protein
MDGSIVGPILERDGNRLRVGSAAPLFLPVGTTCDLRVGTLVRVTITQRDGRDEIASIQPLPQFS